MSDNDENGKPYPKDSQVMNDENIPKESINNENNQYKEENENNEVNDNMQNNEEENNFPEEQNDENENKNDFPKPGNDDFDDYMNDNKNNDQKDDFNEDYNQDNEFKDNKENIEKLDNNNNSQYNNNDTFRISNTNDNRNTQNNRDTGGISNNNQNDTFNNFENNFDNDKDNDNQNHEENNNNNGIENNNFNNNNINRNSDSFGFRDSSIKDNNVNNNAEKDIRTSGNSDQFKINNNNQEEKNENKNSLRNKPNNNFNNSKNNNFNNNNLNNKSNNNNFNNNNFNNNNFNNNNFNNNNYARNPFTSNNNNYNNNGGFGMGSYNNNINQTAANFIPQDNNVVHNLNYNYSSNYNSTDQKHHSDYDPQYEEYEELPEDSDGFHLDPSKKGKDSSTIAGIQIANTIMGAGILSIPIVMNYLGILLGLVIILFLAISTIYSVNILIRCHEITGKSGYSMFGKITMGKFGSILIKVIIIINNLGICVCYFRIFGEVLQTIFQLFVSPSSYFVTNWHNYIYILFGSLIMLPFIFKKSISSLKRVSYLGVISVFIFTIALSILLFYKSASNKLTSDIDWDFFVPNCTFTEAFHVTPTVFLAFLFQFNVFPIYYSMKHREMSSMMKATKIGVGYSLIIFLLSGIIGFLLYGSDIEDTILDNLSDDMIAYRSSNILIIVLILIISISFIITCLTSFPVLFQSLRVNYINALTVCIKSCKKTEEVQISQGNFEEKHSLISEKVLIIITIMLYVFMIIFAIVIYKLKTMFTIIGASAGSFIGFILPSLFYIIIVKKSQKNYSLILPYVFLFIGIFFFVIALLLAIF